MPVPALPSGKLNQNPPRDFPGPSLPLNVRPLLDLRRREIQTKPALLTDFRCGGVNASGSAAAADN